MVSRVRNIPKKTLFKTFSIGFLIKVRLINKWIIVWFITLILIEDDEILEEFYQELDWVNLSHSIVTLKTQLEWLFEEIDVPPEDSDSDKNLDIAKSAIPLPPSNSQTRKSPRTNNIPVKSISKIRESIGLDYLALLNSDEII